MESVCSYLVDCIQVKLMILVFIYLHFSGAILVVLLSYYLGFAMEMEDILGTLSFVSLVSVLPWISIGYYWL